MSQRVATAEWANPELFAEQNLYSEDKFWLGRSPLNGLPLGYNDDRHICLVSGSRAGKGTSTIINNLCQWQGSLVVVDPKGESATVSAARRGDGSDYCLGLGQDVHVLDPFQVAKVNETYRSQFNPLDSIDPDHYEAIDEAGRLADAIVVVNPESKDPYWDDTARTMIKGIILYVLTEPDFDGRRNLLTVRQLILRGDWETLELLKKEEIPELPTGHELLWEGMSRSSHFNGVLSGIGESFRNLAVKNPKQFESVLQVANRHTEFLDSPGMQRCLEKSNFKISDLKTNPKGVSIFLSLPQRFMNTHHRWLRMMISLIITEMEKVQHQPVNGHRILMCLDEFSGLKHMEIVENAVAQIAGYGVKLFFILQSLEQLKAVYKEKWETFLSNSGLKLFFGLEDHFSREYVSKYIGDTELRLDVKTSSTSHTTSESETKSTNRSLTEGENRSSGIGTSSNLTETNSKNTTDGSSRSVANSQSENRSFNKSFTNSSNWGGNRSSSRSKGQSGNNSWKIPPLFFRNTSEVFSLFRDDETRSIGTNTSSSDSSGSSWGGGRSQTDSSTTGFGKSTSHTISDNHSTSTGHATALSRGETQTDSHGTSTSRTMGKSEANTKGFSDTESTGTNETIQKRPLITTDEIGRYFRRIEDCEHPFYPGFILVLISGQPPAIVRRRHYFDEALLVGTYDPHPDNLDNSPPLLIEDFHEYELKFPDCNTLNALSNPGEFQPTIRFCFKKLGDQVLRGEPLLEIVNFRRVPQDDFETITVFSPVSGVLTSFNVQNGSPIQPEFVYASIKHSVRRNNMEVDYLCEDTLKIHTNRLIEYDDYIEKRTVRVNDNNWFINDDGTVSDDKNKLMWMRAPWGCNWNGTSFDNHSRPLLINWYDAADKFGRGKAVKPIGEITSEETIRSSSKHFGYTLGNQKINFAGYADWRLPTIAEFSTILFGVQNDCQHKRDAFGKLFPLVKAHNNTGFWTANNSIRKHSATKKILFAVMNSGKEKLRDDNVAWSVSYSYILREGAGNPHNILLVRDLI